MTTLEILRAARALIAQPGRWCQGSYARYRDGRSVSAMGPLADSFCALGGCRRVSGGACMSIEPEHALTETARSMGRASAHHLNDTTDLPTVLAMFDATIARLESQNVG